jgi:hypothetical protein
MRRLWTASLVLGGCFLFLVNKSAQQSEQELRALVPRIVASWETFDLSKIDPYYAADADLAYFDLAPLKYNNWAEYRATVPKVLFEPNSSLKLKVNDAFAWFFGLGHLHVWRRDNPQAGQRVPSRRPLDHGPRKARERLDRRPRARLRPTGQFLAL